MRRKDRDILVCAALSGFEGRNYSTASRFHLLVVDGDQIKHHQLIVKQVSHFSWGHESVFDPRIVVDENEFPRRDRYNERTKSAVPKNETHRTTTDIVVAGSLMQGPDGTWSNFTKNPCSEGNNFVVVGFDIGTVAHITFNVCTPIYQRTIPQV